MRDVAGAYIFCVSVNEKWSPDTDPFISFWWQNNTDRLLACYREVADNILDLKESDEMLDFLV